MKILSCIAAVLLVSATPSMAAVGTITEQTANPASIARNKSNISGNKGTGIEMQDVVDTTSGKVGITFRDETKVEVSDHSRLEIDEFVYDPAAPSSSKIAVNFAQGTLRMASGAIAHNDPSKVSVNTPAATISVRGTNFTATVDEMGASTIILLPECPRVWRDIEQDCRTGRIEVSNAAGSVMLDRPFHATKVENRNTFPTKPVILNISAGDINNLLIVSPPSQIREASGGNRNNQNNVIAGDILTLDVATAIANRASDLIAQRLAEQMAQTMVTQVTVATHQPTELQRRLPDWTAQSQVVPTLSNSQIGLCRPDGASNIQCVYVPLAQNTTISQTQGPNTIVNRVNSGGNTVITLRQN